MMIFTVVLVIFTVKIELILTKSSMMVFRGGSLLSYSKPTRDDLWTDSARTSMPMTNRPIALRPLGLLHRVWSWCLKLVFLHDHGGEIDCLSLRSLLLLDDCLRWGGCHLFGSQIDTALSVMVSMVAWIADKSGHRGLLRLPLHWMIRQSESSEHVIVALDHVWLDIPINGLGVGVDDHGVVVSITK